MYEYVPDSFPRQVFVADNLCTMSGEWHGLSFGNRYTVMGFVRFVRIVGFMRMRCIRIMGMRVMSFMGMRAMGFMRAMGMWGMRFMGAMGMIFEETMVGICCGRNEAIRSCSKRNPKTFLCTWIRRWSAGLPFSCIYNTDDGNEYHKIIERHFHLNTELNSIYTRVLITWRTDWNTRCEDCAPAYISDLSTVHVLYRTMRIQVFFIFLCMWLQIFNVITN